MRTPTKQRTTKRRVMRFDPYLVQQKTWTREELLKIRDEHDGHHGAAA